VGLDGSVSVDEKMENSGGLFRDAWGLGARKSGSIDLMFWAHSRRNCRDFYTPFAACERVAKSDLQMPQSTGENFRLGSVEAFPAFLFPES